MSKVVAAGYVGLKCPDLDDWRKLGTDVLGAVVAPATTEDHLFLRIDERGWRIRVEKGEPGLAFSGWEVANEKALEALAEDLDSAGIPYEEDSALAKERRV